MSSIFGKLFEKKSKLEFYSQYLQDKWLYETFFSSKRKGVFLEIGADDGVDKSNSYFFEQNLEWSGMCVEPSPKRFQLLAANRKCICENYAVAESDGEVEFMDISGWGKGLSGIVEDYDPKHRDRIEKEIKHPDNKGYEMVKVQAIPLDSLLRKHAITQVDFCTIDTEGSELNVLKSIDFKYCHIDVILVENNYEDTRVKDFLAEEGFVMKTSIAIDDVYVNKRASI